VSKRHREDRLEIDRRVKEKYELDLAALAHDHATSTTQLKHDHTDALTTLKQAHSD